jgi:hypothetical protein
MRSFKDFRKKETVDSVIDDLEHLKMHHNFSKMVSKDYLYLLANQLEEVGIEPEDIYASIDSSPDKQEEYLLYKSAPGCGMGKGALGDLKNILKTL